MKQPRRSLLGLLLALLFVFNLALQLPPATAAAQKGPIFDYADDRVLVLYKPGVSEQEKQQVEKAENSPRLKIIGAGTHLLKVDKGKVLQKIASLKAYKEIASVSPDYAVHLDGDPSDPDFNLQWAAKNTGQSVNGSAGTAGADIRASLAWDKTTGSRDIVVGVIDGGADYTHPDLLPNMWQNPGGVGGCPVGTFGYDAGDKDCDPQENPGGYHGTHVMGIIGAAGNNDLGVTGVNWQVSLMALKFYGSDGNGWISDAIGAIDFAIAAKQAGVNLRVLNASWVSPDVPDLKLAIQRAGQNDILFVAAAGNDTNNNDTNPYYPAGYNTAVPNIISVAATDQSDNLASFSNYGSTSVNLGAPGNNILSTVPNGNYNYLSGTSMASPTVAGAAALILSAMPVNTSALILKDTILKNVDPIPALSGKTTTGGRLDVCRAIAGCGFTLNASPTSATVVRNKSTSYSLSITPAASFNKAVSLSVSGLPSGATYSFTPATVSPSNNYQSTLTITASKNTRRGTYNLTVTGRDGTFARTITLSLSVA
jgi:serine protease